MLNKIVTVSSDALVVTYILSEYYCPNCGNQVVYYRMDNAVSFVCAHCKRRYQIREETRPSLFDPMLISKVQKELSDE